MTRTIKTVVLILFDLMSVLLCLITAFAIKNDNPFFWFGVKNNFAIYAVFGSSAILCNLIFGCYNYISKFMGLNDALRLFCACLLNSLLMLAASFPLRVQSPLSVTIVAGITELMFMCAFRFSGRICSQLCMSARSHFKSMRRNRIIIFGNVDEGKEIIEKLRNEHRGLKYTAIVNDTPLNDTGLKLNGVRILGGGIECLEQSILKHKPDEIIITKAVLMNMPVERLIRLCPAPCCRFKLYSGLEDYPASENFRDICIESLLGRKQARLDKEQIKALIKGKTVLVTGGAGSIGSEICSQTLRFGCAKLIAFDICENGLFELDNKLNAAFGRGSYEIVVGSVRDSQRLDEIFSAHHPDIVFHAAAHKHVPLMELNPIEAVKNNIIGTYNTAKTAAFYKAERFILISTDKAVNPPNIMGATKRAAEMLMHSFNLKTSGTIFTAVRFGNVLGSNGSVVPFFKNQIKSGGPVTVTHPDIKRYFMTVQEAVQLVMQAGAIAKGGEIFMLDMGEPVKIADLAYEMIKLSGYEPGKDIKIEYTGLRPGEKMSEELIQEDEELFQTGYDKLFVCIPSEIDGNFDDRVEALCRDLSAAACTDVKTVLKGLVREYRP